MFVSAIVTAKGIPDFINTAIDCLLAQTCQPNEVIISLDGMRDETADVVKRRLDMAGYPIPNTVITSSRNQGTAMTRNAGIMIAKGDIICFNDGDDWFLPERIEKGIEAMDLNRKVTRLINPIPPDNPLVYDPPETESRYIAPASFSNFYHLDERGKFNIAHSYPGTYKDLANECFVRPNQMIMAEVFEEIGLFDPAYPQAEDYDFWERYLRVYDIGFNPEPLWVYRRHRLAKVSNQDGYIRANEERAKIQERVRKYINEKDRS